MAGNYFRHDFRGIGKITVDGGGKITDGDGMDITHLIKLADAYQAADGATDTTLSFRMFKDSKKLTALRNGKDITTARFRKAHVWFHENWPDNAQWPKGVPFPAKRGEAA